jgi:hypothetical protein
MTQAEVDSFEKVQAQIQGLHSEVSSLSKKSQNDALNKFKLKLVNQLVQEDDIPTNSDVALMLTQYLNCLEKLRADNIIKEDKFPQHWYWKINGKISNIRTTTPKIIQEK